MSTSDDGPVKLISVPTEQEAAIIVAMLADQGIEARAVGGFTAGFRAEAPGSVEVWVSPGDLEASRTALGVSTDPDGAYSAANEEPASFDTFRQRVKYRDPLYVFFVFVAFLVFVAPLLLSLLATLFSS